MDKNTEKRASTQRHISIRQIRYEDTSENTSENTLAFIRQPPVRRPRRTAREEDDRSSLKIKPIDLSLSQLFQSPRQRKSEDSDDEEETVFS